MFTRLLRQYAWGNRKGVLACMRTGTAIDLDSLNAGWRSEGLSQGPVAAPLEFQRVEDPPSRFTLDGVVYGNERNGEQHSAARPILPMMIVWRQVLWAAACSEVNSRFGDNHRLQLTPPPKSKLTLDYTMFELYVHLFQTGAVTQPDKPVADIQRTRSRNQFPPLHRGQWQSQTLDLHNALHDKMVSSSDCPICAESRLWQDSRRHHADWDFKSLCLLWETVVSTIQKHGTGWVAWRDREIILPLLDILAELRDLKEIPKARSM